MLCEERNSIRFEYTRLLAKCFEKLNIYLSLTVHCFVCIIHLI